MKFKNAFLLFALTLALSVSSSAALADVPTVITPEQSNASVDFLFASPSFGQVTVHAAPGSAFFVRALDPFGNNIMLVGGMVDADGVSSAPFFTPPFVSVSTITVVVMSPGQPGLFFSFDGELDRWILD